jgi:hypothetical protein
MNPLYSRLPGARRTPISKETLWLASDHLLVVHSNRISERYQRIYFKDIQALIVDKPDTQQKQFVLGGCVALLMIVVVSLLFNGHYFIALPFFLLLFIPLTVLLMIGDVRCYAQTALGRYRLGALRNENGLQNALAMLTPMIMEAQKKKEEPVDGVSTTEVL